MQIKFIYSATQYVSNAFRATTCIKCTLCSHPVIPDEFYTRRHGWPVCWSCRPFVIVRGGPGADKLTTVGLPPLTSTQQAEIADLATRRVDARRQLTR